MMKSYDPFTTEYTGEVFNCKPDAIAYVETYLGIFVGDFDVTGICDEMFDLDFERTLYYAKSLSTDEIAVLLVKYAEQVAWQQ